MKYTSFSLADKLDEAGRMVISKRSAERRHEEVLQFEAASMIRCLSIKLHKSNSRLRIMMFLNIIMFALFVAVLIQGG